MPSPHFSPQVSGAEGVPPPQEYPSSTVQVELQPSLLMRFPSSQASCGRLLPSPQTVDHTSRTVPEPPTHLYPFSTVHDPLQPSPEFVLPSSHTSVADLRPSPHTGTHELTAGERGGLKVPNGQFVHTAFPTREYVFAGQSKQEDEPWFGWYFPGGQLYHEVALDKVVNFPAGQRVHEVADPVEYLPSPQSSQWVCRELGLYSPPGQFIHDGSPEFE